MKHSHALTISLAVACAPALAQTPSPEEIAAARPGMSLRTEYHSLVRAPLQHVGYSFPEAQRYMDRMAATGCETILTNAMWIPVQDPTAKDGLGISPPDASRALGQVFLARGPFDGFAPRTPTRDSATSGCRWRLMTWRNGAPGVEIATGAFENVPDNSWPEAVFEKQQPGEYLFEIYEPGGAWIGWWQTPTNVDDESYPVRNREPFGAGDFCFRLRTGGAWNERVFSDPATAIALGPTELEFINSYGMQAGVAVGNWNNPGFTYYPDWFFDVVPEAAVIKADGEEMIGPTMFDRTIAVPNISTAEIVDGTSRFIRATVKNLAGHPASLYWVMGGEALYATYSSKGTWVDYSDNEVAHYRAWLESVRYDSLDALNRAQGTEVARFAEAEPPRAPSDTRIWLDWLDFRFDAMGERKAWHWQAVRDSSWDAPAFSCNHGTLFHGDSYAAMGADFARFATNTDGFETGQIIRDTDPDYYNLLYVDSIIGLGKPYAPARLAYVDPDPTARGGGKSFTPDAVWRYGYETLAAGAWHLGFIEYEGTLPDGEWQIMDTPGEQATIDFFAFAKEIAPDLANMHPMKPRLGVWVPHNEWAVDGFAPEWIELHRALLKNHVPKHFIYDAQLRGRLVDDYDAILVAGSEAPDLDALRGLMYFAVTGKPVAWIGDQPQGAALSAIQQGAPGIRLMPGVTPEQIAANLARSTHLVRMASRNEVRRPIVRTKTPSTPDDPIDLATVGELGQTFVVENDGLEKLSIRMPTYYGVSEDGFAYVVRKDGPEGDLVQEGSVPGPISDNAWLSIEMTEAPEAGETLYFGVSVPEDFPEETLGWWGTTEDFVPDGTAWADGEPIPGDREHELAYASKEQAADATLAFALTDGLSAALVLINTSKDEAMLTVDLNPLATRLPLNQEMTITRLPERRGPAEYADLVDLEIGPSNGTILLLEPVIDDETAGALQAAAEKRIAAWTEAGTLTEYQRYAAAEAERLRTVGRVAKAAAMDVAVAGQLGLQIDAPGQGESAAHGDTYIVSVLDADGQPVDADRVWVEVTPSQGNVADLRPSGDGEGYELTLDDDVLPPRYDYRARRYEPFWGPVRLRVAARKGGLAASQFVDLVLEPAAAGPLASVSR